MIEIPPTLRELNADLTDAIGQARVHAVAQGVPDSMVDEIDGILTMALDCAYTLDIIPDVDYQRVTPQVTAALRDGLVEVTALRRAISLYDGRRRPSPVFVAMGIAVDSVGHALFTASGFLHAVTVADHIDGNTGSAHRCVAVAWPAGKLAGIVPRLLPAPDRARYAEEFRSELWELAHAGASWRGQLSYALRLITRAGNLRLTLRDPRPHKASQ